MDKLKHRKLLCFSPPVMLATFLIEFLGAAYIFIKYKSSTITRLTIAILICLGTFQIAEYLICEQPALPGFTWSRIGYVAITLLPPLGISLAMAITGKRSVPIQITIYTIATAFASYYLFFEGALSSQTCAGNYVIFESINPQTLYGLYYYGLLIAGTSYCFFWAKKSQKKNKRSALIWLAIGYLSFIIPTTTVNFINPDTIAAIPSIMCGFAVFLALILIFAVIPKTADLRSSKN